MSFASSVPGWSEYCMSQDKNVDSLVKLEMLYKTAKHSRTRVFRAKPFIRDKVNFRRPFDKVQYFKTASRYVPEDYLPTAHKSRNTQNTKSCDIERETILCIHWWFCGERLQLSRKHLFLWQLKKKPGIVP